MNDKATISRLITALQSLRDSHETDSGGYEKVWADGTIESLKNLDYWTESPEVVLEARSTLSDLKKIRDVLASLSSSLEESIMGIEEYIRPFQFGMGLSSIPDEMLSRVLEHAVEETSHDPIIAKGNLSLVCHRFRQLVLNTPRLWSRIKRNDKMPHVRACLERSKSVGLSIYLAFGNATNGLDQELSLLAEVLQHSSRWECLDVLFIASYREIDMRKKIPHSALFSNLYLPSLHSLELRYDTLSAEPDVLANDDLRHFYHSWEMPNLRSFGTNIIPKPFIAPELTLVYLWNFHLKESPAAGELLRDFLNAFPGLEELHLSCTRDVARGYPGSHLLHLPNLKILRIVTIYEYMSDDIYPFMVALRAPNLRKLEIELVSPTTNYDRNHVLDSFFPLEVYPSLEELSLEMISDERMEFHLPFKKFPGLCTLSMDSQYLLPSLDFPEEDYAPALRTLKIANCGEMDLYWLESLREAMVKGGTWKGFKRLDVTSALKSSFAHEIHTLYAEEDKDVIRTVERGDWLMDRI